MNIYLDIDGVLLNDGLDNQGTPTKHAVELLRYLTDNHDVHWLTTHCMNGENHATTYLSAKIPEAKDYILKIKPTTWSSWKTEAINFEQDFRWIDDDVYKPELDALESNKASDKLMVVNLRENPNRLMEIIDLL